MAYSNNYGGYGNNYGNDYNTTSYGAQGGADGGGFMAGSQPQGSQGGQRKRGNDTLHPCTILQVLSAHEQPSASANNPDHTIDGIEVNNICIIGQIRNITKQVTHNQYMLDDGTGTIDVKQWVDSERPTQDELGNPLPPSKYEAGLVTGEWVRCYGKIKSFGDKRHVGAQALRPCKDKNEINYHLLEATAAHLYATRGPPQESNGAPKQEESLFVTADDGNSRSTAGLSHPALQVLRWFQQAPRNNEGYHAQMIAQEMNMPINKVLDAGMELSNSSFIFATLNDETWTLT